jgi:hypothetical protein
LVSDIKAGAKAEGVCEKGAEENIWRDNVTGGWNKLYNEEFHNLYSSPSTLKIIKSRRM